MADLIRDYSDCVAAGERLNAQIVENDRSMADHYRAIRDALSRPSMADAAILDAETGHAYIMTTAGMVGRFRLVASEDVPVADDVPASCEAVCLGEAS